MKTSEYMRNKLKGIAMEVTYEPIDNVYKAYKNPDSYNGYDRSKVKEAIKDFANEICDVFGGHIEIICTKAFGDNYGSDLMVEFRLGRNNEIV